MKSDNKALKIPNSGNWEAHNKIIYTYYHLY